MAEEKFNTLHYVIAELKQYGIKHVVASPGTQNSTFNMIVQEDSDFECFSVVDERSASYVALGMAREVDNPVVITCTGATAARNYISAMTEAFYSDIPIIALTFYNQYGNSFNMEPQFTDKNVSQNDIKSLSVKLPEIKDGIDKNHVKCFLNAALSKAKYENKPVHIAVPASFNYAVTTLPQDVWHTEYIRENFSSLQNELKNKKFAVFIGNYTNIDKDFQNALSEFAKSYNIPVICDHYSNYNGSNKILTSQFSLVTRNDLLPSLIIDLGGISAIYNKGNLFTKADIWRVSQNTEYKCRHNRPLLKFLLGLEKNIFSEMKNKTKPASNYYEEINQSVNNINTPELPLSVTYIGEQLAKHIPNDSSLHLAIARSAEVTNHFNLPNNIRVSCNVGGFGIDGCISTAVGHSLADYNKKVFCLTGDLAFFYDMNILGCRHINKNFRIIVSNNSEGVTMRGNPRLSRGGGEIAQVLVCAAEHFKGGAKGWAESCGFKYMRADTKEEFNARINDFCNKDYGAPVLFEVFVNPEADLDSMRIMHRTCINKFNMPDEKISFVEKIFSVRNERGILKKHKVVRILGAKIKFKVKEKYE